MSKMKKFASLLLALALVLALGVSAFAADDASITITGAQSGHTYTAYQIFTGTLSEDGSTLSDVVWGSAVTDSASLLTALVADSTIGSSFTTDMTAAQVAEVVAKWGDNSVTLNAFAAVVAKYVASGTVLTASAAGDGTYTHSATDLADGYYLVVDTASELADGDAISRYIIQVIGSVEIETKTGTTTFEKEASDVSVEVGQTVTYTLTSTVPDTTYYTTYTWSVSDTMSEGLTFDGTDSITVAIGSAEVTDYTVTATDNGFTLSIDMTKYTAGQEVVITYTATVNAKAVSVLSNNAATLTYSNNPNDSTSTDTITDETTVYSAKVTINKYGDDDKKNALSGATFVLYKYDEDGTTKLYYKYTEDDPDTDADESAVSWVSDITAATKLTTDEDGVASFIGLEDGTYYLEETAAPDGYNSLSEDVEVTINGAKASADDLNSLAVIAEINNESGSELPSTGGIGTTIFYIIGSIMVLGAVVLLITRKRMSKAE